MLAITSVTVGGGGERGAKSTITITCVANFFLGGHFIEKSKILKGRLPPEDSSVRRETLGKRVSDDFAKMIFRGEKVFRGDIFWKNRKFRRAVFFSFRHGTARGGANDRK